MQEFSPGTRPSPIGTEPMACVISAGARRLMISGVLGVREDGTPEKGMRAQLERAFANLIATCEAAGFRKEQIIRIATTVTEPGRFPLYREIRALRIYEGASDVQRVVIARSLLG